METHGNSPAVSFLNAVIDGQPTPRKALALDAGVSEPTFAKLTRSSAFELLDRLPRDLRVEWLRRYAAFNGLEVRDVDPGRVADAIREATKHLEDLVDRYDAIVRVRVDLDTPRATRRSA